MFDRETEHGILQDRLTAWEAHQTTQSTPPDAEVQQHFSDAWYNLGSAAQAAFTYDDRRLGLFDRAIALNPDHLKARLGKVFSLNYSTQLPASAIFQCHRDNGMWLEQKFSGKTGDTDSARPASERLRIGYLSSDFRTHSVAHFILPVLQQHDREKFELYLYYNHGSRDSVTEKCEQLADRFFTVNQLSDTALHRTIREHRIDVLIELNGLSEYNRIAALCQRPAPVQISWIGYPNTTGLSVVDYRIVDAITDPPDTSASLSTETLIHMPRTFSVYQPADELPHPGPLPNLSRGFITFGSFNSMPKLNEALLQSWCRMLLNVDSSRILMKNIALDFPEPRRQILNLFEAHGVDPERVDLRGPTGSQLDHLRTISEVDISLDSFPYNGTTTTCDCLMMGVPVVTRAGQDHRSRVSASQLTALGLNDLIGQDEDSTIDIAVALAKDPQRLQALRTELPRQMRASALMDAKGFTRELEARLTEAWVEKQKMNTSA